MLNILKINKNYGIIYKKKVGDTKTICINIINFNMFDRSDYHTEIVASIKDTGEIFSDKFSIHFFELKKVGKEVNPNNRRELWMQFLNASSEEEFEVLKQTNVPIMNKAVNIIYDLSEDTKIREMARLREKALHDEASALANAKNEGKAEGRAEGISIGEAKGRAEGEAKGRTEERNALIKKMRKRGMSEDEIKEFFAD